MVISCDVSNKIIAGAITSESILQRIILDMDMIDNYEKAIAKLGDNTDGIATLAYAKKGVESKILYQTIGSYITKTLQEEGLSKAMKIDELKKTLAKLIPENSEYINKLDQLSLRKSYTRGSVDDKKIASVIAFDIANIHKLEGVTKGGIEYIHYGKLNVGGAYDIYKDVMLDIVHNKNISETDLLTKIRSYVSDHDAHTKEWALNNPDDIVDIINNAKSMKQLEETFVFYIHYMDETTLPVLLNKIDDFKYSEDVTTKTFWQSLGESYFNPEKYVVGYNVNLMNTRALAYGKFKGVPFDKKSDDYFVFIDKAADLITGKSTNFTWKGVEFNNGNKDVLAGIVGINNLEVAYARRGETSIQYDYLKQLQNADKNIEIVPDKLYDIGITNVKGYEKQTVDKLVNKGKSLEKKGEYIEAQKVFDESIKPGIDVIKNRFGKNIDSIGGGIGRYDKQSEPTIILKLKNVTDNDIDDLVDLSDKGFKQKSFFVAEPANINDKPGIVDEKLGLSIEPGIVIYTKNKITLENAKEIDKMFGELGIYGGTILPNGNGIKLYNLSAFNKDYEQFKKQIKGFVQRLKGNKSIGISGRHEENLFRIRHLGIDKSEGLGTYDGWRKFRGGSFLNGKKLVSTTQEYKYNDVLTAKSSEEFIDSKRGTQVEFVSSEELSKFQEFDRRTTLGLKDNKYIEELKLDIKQNGIKEPLIVAYYKGDKKALLIEGNTRLTIGKELGISEFPVKVIRYEGKGPQKAIRVKGVKSDINGYVKGDLFPSEIGINVKKTINQIREEANTIKLTTKEYKYNDALTVKARSFDNFKDFEKSNRLQKGSKASKEEHLKNIKKARKQKDDIAPVKKQTKEEIQQFGPNTEVVTNKHSIVKVISNDNNTPPTKEHIFYQPFILHSDYNKGRYNDIWSVNSFEIGTPKDIILDKKALIDRINNSGESTIYVMTRDASAAKELKEFGHEKGIKVIITYPKYGGSSIRIIDGKAYVGYVNGSAYRDFIDSFNSANGKVFASNILVEPIETLKQITIGDKNITQEIIDMYALYSPTNTITFTELSNILRNTSRFDGRYTNEIVDYTNAYKKVQAMEISDIIDDIEDLTNTKITLEIDPTNVKKIKKDYYNYHYAQDDYKKIFAKKKLLENFQLDIGDADINYAKKSYIYKKLRLGERLDINVDGFDDFVTLLLRDDVSDEMLRDNFFIKNTLTKNQSTGNPVVATPRDFYTYNKSKLLKEADDKIYNKNTVTSEFVQGEINVPTEGVGLSLIDNDVLMPPTNSRIWDIIGAGGKYENGKFVVDSSILKQAKNGEPLDVLGNSDQLIKVIDFSKEGVDELFSLYIKKIDEIIRIGGDNQWRDLQKLYDNFEYKLIQLEGNMQSSLGKSLEYGDKLSGFHHAIGRYSQDLDYNKYIQELDKQRNNILETLEKSRININNGVANGGLLNNGNILKGSIIEDGANYAYYLGKQSGDNAPYDILKEMDSNDLKNYINVQKTKIASDIESKGLIYHMYKAISPTLRNYGFLDEYALVDTLYGYKLPKALVDVNPSLYSNGKALSMDLNDELLLNTYRGIVDMYNEGYQGLRITGNIDENLKNIQTIVDREVENLVSKYPKKEFSDATIVNIPGIKASYTDVFLPYSSFLVIPQETITDVARLKNMDGGNISDFLGLYLSKKPTENVMGKILYDKPMLEKITKDVNNIEVLANDGWEQTYKDVFTGGITDWMMRQGRGILEKKGKNENILLNIQLATKASGKQMSNFLYNIVAKNMLRDVNLGKETNKAFRMDFNLLRDSQNTLSAIAKKNNTELDAWLLKNSKTSDLVAYHVARYINTYKTLLKGIVDDDVLGKLHNVFYMIGRKVDGSIDDLADKVRVTEQVHRLATIGESNSFLGIFNMSTAPKTELSNISFNIFEDGRVFVKNVNKEMDQFDGFNQMFKTNLTKEEYEQLFQNMFGGKLVTWKNWIQKSYSFVNKYILSIIGPIIKFPTVIGLNALSAFTTGFLPGYARGKALIKGISKSDSKILADIIGRYNLLGEFFDLSDTGMVQLFKEAEKLGGGNIGRGLIRSFQSGSAANSMSLIYTNTNNVMDVALMGNYKMFALYSSMQSLDGKRFFSVKKFDEYLKTLSDNDLQKLMYLVEGHANRGLYSVIAAADSFMDQRIPSIGLEIFGVKASANITRYGSSLIRGLSHNLSFLNGRGNGIVRWFASGVFGNLDIAKYLIKNKFSNEALESVVRAIEKRPEYLQWLSTMYADISLLARGYRYQKTGEDDGQTDLEDFMDALGTYTTVGNGWNSSLPGQLTSRVFSTGKKIEEQEKITPTDEFKKGKIYAWTFASTISGRFMAQLKYLKPRKYTIAQAQADINKGMEPNDAYAKAIWTMLLNAGSGMLKFMVSDNYDPSQLSVTFQDRGDTPEVMGGRLSEDQEAAYAQTYIQYGDLGNFANFLPNMWKASMLNSLIKKPIKNMLNGYPLSEDDVVYLTYNEPLLYKSLYLGETPEATPGDVMSIKNYIFDDSLLDVAYMRIYMDSSTGKIKEGRGYLDDAITAVYDSIGKDGVQKIYQAIQDTSSKNKDNVKQIAYNLLKEAVENGDLGETEELAKSMLFQASISLDVHNRVPSGKGVTERDKEQYYLNEFKDKYQILKGNNSQIALNFILRKNDRINTEATSKLYDDKGNINDRYYDYIKREVDARDAIRNGDIDMVEALHNPLVISQKYLGWKLKNDDGTLNEEAIASFAKSMNYIAGTETDRGVGETVAMLIASVKPVQEEVIDAAQKGLLSGGLSRATKELIDKYFYTEGLLADYILNLHTGVDTLQGGSGSSKIKWAMAEFESLSDALDKIRGDFESEINISNFDIDHYPLNSVDDNVFVARPTGSYTTPSGIKTSFNIQSETQDINRKIKKSKEFKFKD